MKKTMNYVPTFLKLKYFVLKVELMITFPLSRRSNRASELRKGVDADKVIPLFERSYSL